MNSAKKRIPNKHNITERKKVMKKQVNKEKKVYANEVYAYVDGSYNPEKNLYGYGGFLSVNGNRYYMSAAGDDPELLDMHNVAGEICGAMAAIDKALELSLDHIKIYYDYEGIEKWTLTGSDGWKAKKKGTKRYAEYVKAAKDKIDISFEYVKGHSGVEGNEIADRLAKAAVNVEVCKTERNNEMKSEIVVPDFDCDFEAKERFYREHGRELMVQNHIKECIDFVREYRWLDTETEQGQIFYKKQVLSYITEKLMNDVKEAQKDIVPGEFFDGEMATFHHYGSTILDIVRMDSVTDEERLKLYQLIEDRLSIILYKDDQAMNMDNIDNMRDFMYCDKKFKTFVDTLEYKTFVQGEYDTSIIDEM